MAGAPERLAMSRGLALLFGAGATLGAVTLVLPHGEGEAPVLLLVPVGVAYAVAAVLLGARAGLPVPALHVLVALGTALIGTTVIVSGRAGSAYAFMYIWVALYAAAFFRARVAAGHIAWAGVSYAAALAIGGDVGPAGAHWLMALGTSAVAGALIFWLARELRGRAADLAAVAALANRMGASSEISPAEVAGAVCAAVQASTGARGVVLVAEEPGGERRPLGLAGEPRALAAEEGEALLDDAQRAGEPRRLLVAASGRWRGTLRALVQPVSREGRAVGALAIEWAPPLRGLRNRTADTVALFAAEAGVALERIARQSDESERRALELNDQVVQGLVVAVYALRDGRVELARETLDQTLARARALVEGQLERLHGDSAPEPGALRRRLA